MEPNDEGMSTTKKVVAGAAVGVAVPAAVGIAKKLLGSDDEDGSGQADGQKEARPATKPTGTTSRSGQSRSRSGQSRTTSAKSTAKSRATGTKSRAQSRTAGRKSSATGRTRSGTAKKSSPKRAAATRTGSTSATRTRKTGASKSSGGSTRSRSGAEKTKEQLYREAKRLDIDGRSKMSKSQLERAVSRAR